MSFVRPEVLERLKQYQEVAWGIAAVVLGVIGFLAGGFITFISIPLLLAGAAFVFLGLRRARFRILRAKAPISDGVVEMVEQEVTFFSSGIGGTIAMDQVVKIEIQTIDKGPNTQAMHWIFYQRDGQPVRIPSGAVGAEGLFDALVAFPGADYEKVIAASQSTQNSRFLIWQDEGYISRRMLH
ncbi:MULTISPECIES: hypothetical protein [Falsihalocynthiibacter]|uniref:Uncharacterized protein n=1 Tax=Falsihalocynthiibacter arcticus TaxID=1579316 RepID=A0A126UZR7_9RHOB|nr:hypothetical protein [Falsihalocynthiibacter arcticus]AML51205.1 hypothetical protein RC74_07990 [Falsihalocynthiibacter arcticus]